MLDPDEGVTAVVRQAFSLFRSLGSAYAVARHFASKGLLFPRRRWQGGSSLGPLTWGPLRATRLHQILGSPVYAGAYVYGRRPLRPVVRDGKLVGARQVTLPRAEWEVDLPGAHPGYITPQEHQENLHMLTMNRTVVETGERQGRPRGGTALLQGLVICGRCGRRMHVRYRGDTRSPVYLCERTDGDISRDGASLCWSVPGTRIDAAVERHVLSQVTRHNLDLSLEVLHRLEQDVSEVDRQWQLRLERAQQDAARAERQYHLVEPENRLVVRTLERRWEEKLAELEHRHAEERREPRLTLSAEERARVLALARDLPAVWRASTTRAEDRKEILGLLVRQFALVPEDLPERQTRVRLLWQGGATTELTVGRPDKYTAVRTSPECLTLIRELMQEHSDAGVAKILAARGLQTGQGRPWSARAVCTARHRHDLPRKGRDMRAAARLAPRADGRYSARAVATLIGVDRTTVHYWRSTGLLSGIREGDGPWWFELTPELAENLRNRETPATVQKLGHQPPADTSIFSLDTA